MNNELSKTPPQDHPGDEQPTLEATVPSYGLEKVQRGKRGGEFDDWTVMGEIEVGGVLLVRITRQTDPGDKSSKPVYQTLEVPKAAFDAHKALPVVNEATPGMDVAPGPGHKALAARFGKVTTLFATRFGA